MSINKGFEQRGKALEDQFIHQEDVAHLREIKEHGVAGAQAHEFARQAAAGLRTGSIKPDAIAASRGNGEISR